MRIKGIAKFAALGAVLALTLLMPAGTDAQKAAQTFTWAAPTGASVQAFDLSRFGGFASKHTIQVRVTGSPTCTVKLEGTNLGPEDTPADADYFSLSGDVNCASPSMVHIVNKPVRTVRMNRTVWSGGTAPTLSVVYTYGQ